MGERVRPGAKWFGTKLLAQDHIPTSTVCQAFINWVREVRHLSTVECQKARFNRLWHKLQVTIQTTTKAVAVMVAMLADTHIQLIVPAKTQPLPRSLSVPTTP